MSRTTRTVSGTVVALAVLAGTAVAAAPAVGPQTTYTGHKAPVSVPGNHLHRGDRIPKGAVLVLRKVESDGAGTSRAVLTLPKGKRLTGIAVAEGSASAIKLPKKDSRYVGRRRVTIEVVARKGDSGTTTVYAYGR